MKPHEQIKFTVRLSSNAAVSKAVIAKIYDHAGLPASLFTNSDFVAAQRDKQSAALLQRDRFARTLQIQATFHEMALQLIAEIEAQEGGWSEFDRQYATLMHQPMAVA